MEHGNRENLNQPKRAKDKLMTLLNEEVLTREIEKDFETPLKIVVANEALDRRQLTSKEALQLKEFKVSGRRVSWLKGRAALKQLLKDWGESDDTADISFPNPRFSLTHSGNYAVAVGTNSTELFGIGVDLEMKRSPHPESARFFLTDEEQACVKHLENSVVPKSLIRLWTVKEAVFKSDPENKGTGLADYRIENPQKWSGRAFRVGEGSVEFRYSCFQFEQGVLSIAIFPRRYCHA